MAPTLEEVFAKFAVFGDTNADGTTIKLSQIDKWLKQAGVIDGKKITTTDTGICFNKFKSKTIDYKTFKKFLNELAKEKKVDIEQFESKLINCSVPGTNKATEAAKDGVVDRLTDTKQYTGSHKERFDESGKGKGIAGREDIADSGGYVQGYKGQGTYDSKK